MQRTQIYLDEKHTAVLDARARREHRTRSAVIRDLIAAAVAEDVEGERELAARQKVSLLSLGSVGRDLRPELEASREADRRRQDELDEQRDSPR